MGSDILEIECNSKSIKIRLNGVEIPRVMEMKPITEFGKVELVLKYDKIRSILPDGRVIEYDKLPELGEL